jgi:hypothetical protein
MVVCVGGLLVAVVEGEAGTVVAVGVNAAVGVMIVTAGAGEKVGVLEG